jgi:hypothetical protein
MIPTSILAIGVVAFITASWLLRDVLYADAPRWKGITFYAACAVYIATLLLMVGRVA